MLTERKAPMVAIFTATSIEHQAVQAHIKHIQEEVHPQGTIYTRGVFTTPHGPWNIAIVEIGAGNEGVALEGERAVNHLQPDVLLFIGIAGGLKDVRVGDVVVATKIYAYEAGKVGHDGFHTRPNIGRSTYRMEQRARAVARKKDWLSQLIGPVLTQTPAAYVGPVASGEKLLTSTNSHLWRLLQTHYNDALATEMEGHGLLSVAYANPQLEALVIRGISNLIDEKNVIDDDMVSQKTAARHASAFAFAMLNSLCEDERFKGLISDEKSAERTPLTTSPPRLEKEINPKQLHKALQSAFPTRQELQILVNYELDENLNTIASDSNLDDTIFELIRWAKAHGRLEQLLHAALNTRVDNPLMQAIAKQAGFDLPISSLYANKAELSSVREGKSMDDYTPDSARETHSSYATAIDTSTIFIARDKHIDSFYALMETWQSLDLSTMRTSVGEEPSPNNKLLGPVVIVFGQGGLGKSTLLRHYYTLASKPVYRIKASSIIDWEARSIGDQLFSTDQASHQIDPCEYFDILCAKLTKALNKYEKDFEEYEKSKKAIDDAADHVEKSIKRMCAKDEYAFLRRLSRQTTKKVLQICSSQKSGQVLEKIKILLGKNVDIQREHLAQFVETIKRKLGSVFDDYLQPAYRLGSALGTDLHLLAGKDSILVFFDTYERALVGDAWLRIVMYAAGVRVGWIIAGRENLWLGSQQMKEDGALYGYNEIVYYDRARSIDLNAHESGPFTVHDIVTYFDNLQQQDASLPEVGIEEAEHILYATKGIPLVVRIVAEIYAKQHQLDFLREATVQTEIAGRFVHYYFRHVLDDEEERLQLYGLALLRRMNDRQAIVTSLGFNQEQKSNYEKSLRTLHRSYSFLFTGQDQAQFHQDIRHFLRSWLLNNRPVEKIVKRLKKFYLARINALEKSRSYRNVQNRLEDDEWVEAYLDLAEIHYWLDTREGILYSLLFLVAAAGYRSESQNIRYEVLQMGAFFHATMKKPAQKWWDLATQFLYAPSNIYTVEAQAQGLKELTLLLAEGKFNSSSVLSPHTQELEAITWWQLGKVYQNNDEQEALQWYEKALSRLSWQDDLREDILNIYWMRANSAYQKEKYKDCISFLQEALTIKYNFADAYYSLGNTYYALKDYQRAIFNYQYAIEFDNSHFYAYVNLGNAYFARKEHEIAIKEYNQSIKFEGRDATTYYDRANAYAALHDYSASLRDFEQTIALDTNFANAYLNSGHIYSLQQEDAKATTLYKQAYDLKPEDIQIAWTVHWATFTRTPIDEKGLQRLEEIAALDEQHYVAYLCRGIALWIRHRELTAARRELEQAQALEPEEWDPYFWQGMFFASLAQTEEAKEKIDKALKLDLPPLLLTPLYWLETEQPEFFRDYAMRHLRPYPV